MNLYKRVGERINSSEFAKNIMIIFSGGVVAQILPILFMPILTRLYGPKEYGVLGLYVSIGSIAATISTLRYSQAIQISRTKEDAFMVLKFCICTVFAFSVILLFIIIPVFTFDVPDLKIESIGGSILSLPVYVLCIGVNEVLLVWINRNKQFKYISFNRILTTSFTLIISLIWAITVNHSFKGLIFALIFGQMMGTCFLVFRANKIRRFDLSFNKIELKRLLIEFKHFPIYSLPSDLINVVTNQLPILMLNKYATITEVGYFSMSNRMLGLPSAFIGASIGEVFRQRATQDYNMNGTCLPIFMKTFKSLVFIGIVPFAVIALFGPWLFSFFLGNEWTESGHYSQIFAVMFFLRFAISPLTYTFYIAGKQRIDFYVHILMLISTLVPFYLGFTLLKNIYISLILFSISYSLIYIIYLYYSKKYAKQ